MNHFREFFPLETHLELSFAELFVFINNDALGKIHVKSAQNCVKRIEMFYLCCFHNEPSALYTAAANNRERYELKSSPNSQMHTYGCLFCTWNIYNVVEWDAICAE